MYIESTFSKLDDAFAFKENHNHLIGKTSNSEGLSLLKIIIVQMTPHEFGQKWAEQREIFEEPDLSQSISRAEFDLQMLAFDNADLTKKDGHYYEVLGAFHLANGEPRFQPMHMLLSSGFA